MKQYNFVYHNEHPEGIIFPTLYHGLIETKYPNIIIDSDVERYIASSGIEFRSEEINVCYYNPARLIIRPDLSRFGGFFHQMVMANLVFWEEI